jgi:hypothetical protein
MSNFKSGSGNLDFGADSDDMDTEDAPEETTKPSSEATGSTRESVETTIDTNSSEEETVREPPESGSTSGMAGTYPYFVRRNNVGDERETRLEIHVRDSVAAREGQFRSALADALGVSEVSKTDAREFALLAAYEHPEKVAALMKEEGFGTV